MIGNAMNSDCNLEIELKFLIESVPPELATYPSEHIVQGYLITEEHGPTRVRKKGSKYIKCVKTGSGLVRTEREWEISQQDFELFWLKASKQSLEKRRYYIPYHEWKIECDVYFGKLRSLITAEVEFKNESEIGSFTPPNWFGMDVTGHSEYTNSSLSANGIPSSYSSPQNSYLLEDLLSSVENKT